MRKLLLFLMVLLIPMMAMAQNVPPPKKGKIPQPTVKGKTPQPTVKGKTPQPTIKGNPPQPFIKQPNPVPGQDGSDKPKPKTDTYIWVNGEKTSKGTFSASASTITFTVRTDAKSWSVTDKPSWCQVARKTSNEVDIQVTANTQSSERNGFIRIATPRGRSATIEVTQLGNAGTAINPGNGTVTIKRTWVEENVEHGGEQGIMFHAHVNADNLKGQELDFQLWLYQSDESTQVKDTEDGWLWRKETHAPSYDNSEWKDFWFFIPYSQFSTSTPRGQLCFDFDVRDKDFKLLGSASKVAFNYNPPGTGGSVAGKSVSIEKIWVEENAESDGERGIRFHAKCRAKGHTGEDLSFYLWLYEEDNTTQVKDTEGEWIWKKEVHEATYENSLWEDFKFFVPYSKFSSSTPRGTLTYDFEIRDKDFKILAEKPGETFHYNPSGRGGTTVTTPKTNASVTIEKVWVEEGYVNDGERGIMFHAKCEAKGHKGEDLSFYLWLYEQDNSTQVKDTDGEWLWRKEVHNVSYDSSLWEDFKFFVPYSKFGSSTPRGTLSYDFEIRDKDFKILAEKPNQTFNYNPSSTTRSTTDNAEAIIHDVWLEHNVYQNGEKGMKVHGHCTVRNMKGQGVDFMVWFYHKDDVTKVTNPSGGHLYRSIEDTPKYESTEWKDVWFFIPYSDINVSRPFNDDLAVDFVIRRLSNSKDLVRKDKTLFNFKRQ